MRILFVLPLLLACAPEDELPLDGPETCLAQPYRGLIGTNIAAATFPADLNDRVIGPDTAVTMDFDPTRVNFNVDETGVIQSVECG